MIPKATLVHYAVRIGGEQRPYYSISPPISHAYDDGSLLSSSSSSASIVEGDDHSSGFLMNQVLNEDHDIDDDEEEEEEDPSYDHWAVAMMELDEDELRGHFLPMARRAKVSKHNKAAQWSGGGAGDECLGLSSMEFPLHRRRVRSFSSDQSRSSQ